MNRLLSAMVLLCPLLGGCADAQRERNGSDTGQVRSNSKDPSLQSQIDGLWSDSYGDYGLIIRTTVDAIELSDPEDSRWRSRFTDIAVRDGVLHFTQTSWLKSGEYHPVNDMVYKSELQISNEDPQVATLTTYPVGVGPQLVTLTKTQP